MRLISLSVRNFRCLKDVRDVPIHDLTVLIGENDSGKSTILDAIDLVLSKRNPTHDDYHAYLEQPRAAEIAVELVFEFAEGEEKPDPAYLDGDGCLRYRATWRSGPPTFEVMGVRYANSILNQDFTKLKAGEFDGILDQLGIETSSKRNAEVRLQLLEGYLEQERPAKESAWVEVKGQIDRFLPRFERFSSADYENPEAMIRKTLQAVVEAQVYEKDEDGAKQVIQSLSEIAGQWKSRLDEKVGELLGFIRQYNDEIVAVSVDPTIDFAKSFQGVTLRLQGQTGSYPIANKGDGTKRRLFMSILDWDRKVMLETDAKPVIRGYDEPDANLHYEAQRRMYYSLRDLTQSSAKIQAVICTHSLTMIDRAPARNINLLSRDDDGGCQVSYLQTDADKVIEQFLADMSRSMGISNSMIFYERCFVFVEGPTEYEALPFICANLAQTTLVEDGIRVHNLGGCGNWEPFVKLMARNKRDLMLFLLDSDCNDPASGCKLNQRSLTKLGFSEQYMKEHAVYIGTKEFEDAFPSHIIVRVLNDHWPKASGEPWNTSEVDSWRSAKKFSDAIAKAVYEQGREEDDRFSKERFGLELGRICTSDEAPKPLLKLFDLARQIAGIGDNPATQIA